MISTGSNDLFPNKLNLWWIRLAVILIIFPVVAVALKRLDILQGYLISDLTSASSIPLLVIGLSDACYWWREFRRGWWLGWPSVLSPCSPFRIGTSLGPWTFY